MRRLIPVFLAFVLVTSFLGISGITGAATDYFRLLAAFFLLLLCCSLATRRRQFVEAPPTVRHH